MIDRVCGKNRMGYWLGKIKSRLEIDYWMKELYFTSPYRKSIWTIRLEYGEVKNKFVLRTFEWNINRIKVSESPPSE